LNVAAIALGAHLVLAAAPVRAAPCARPDLIETMPPDGASAVPVNAVLHARYDPAAEYVDEDVVLEDDAGNQRIIPATFDANEGLLSIAPADPLLPEERYTVHWPRLRGIGTATLGRGADVHITVGTANDTEPPAFDGATRISWNVVRQKDDCTDTLEERYVFDLSLGAARDDGGASSLTLVVFQTAGPELASGAPKPVLLTRMPDPGQTVRVTRSFADAVGRVCFAAVARDLVGHVSSSASSELCVKTVAPPFFEGCSAASALAPRGTATPALVLAALAGLFVRQKREKRGAPARATMPEKRDA